VAGDQEIAVRRRTDSKHPIARSDETQEHWAADGRKLGEMAPVERNFERRGAPLLKDTLEVRVGVLDRLGEFPRLRKIPSSATAPYISYPIVGYPIRSHRFNQMLGSRRRIGAPILDLKISCHCLVGC
jgi:hypothetical protein